jgi:hypothetical protein
MRRLGRLLKQFVGYPRARRKPRIYKAFSGTGRSGRRANPNLDRLLEDLMESVGRQARRQAAEAIRKADR